MARSDINNPTVQLDTDGGAVLKSILNGEQVKMTVTLNWLIDLTGYTISAKVVEGANDGLGTIPSFESDTPQVVTLPIIDTEVSDNEFDIVFPEGILTGWDVQPTPGAPVYGFFGLKITDNQSGDDKVVLKPISGLVEVRYSPTETS